MSVKFAIAGAAIFDGVSRHEKHSLLVEGGKIVGLCPDGEVPQGFDVQSVDGGLLAPGFIDLQVNGGGGVLLNEQPDVDGIATICRAHIGFGTTGLLPTLITDTPEVTDRAIAAGIEATRSGVPGFLGLHLEGPHLAPSRKGAHDPTLIRTMQGDDLQRLIDARAQLPTLMVTVAPESVSNAQIAALTEAGIVVSLGHSDATYEQVKAAAQAGATCVTHLYNAMSPLSHCQPGMVGAGLDLGQLHCGLIADGHHMDPAVISLSLSAKRGPANIFLVSDAMSTIGSDMTEFVLNGRNILRRDGRLTLEDGTLAGADLELSSAVRFVVDAVGIQTGEALRMASLYPAECIGADTSVGRFAAGQRANIVHLDDTLKSQFVWIDGRPV